MDMSTVITVIAAAAVILGATMYLGKKQLDAIIAGNEENRAEIARQRMDMDKKLEESRKEAQKEIARVDKELADLKADLPLIYVLREDFVRSMTSVENKVTSIDNKIDKLLQK